MTSLNDLMPASKSWQWDGNPKIKGTVVKVERKQQTDIDSGTPLTWDNGDPKMQTVFTLQVAAPTADDDGLRTIYARGGKHDVGEGSGEAMETAIFAAYRKAGITTIEGAELVVEHSGWSVKKKGKNPARLFTAYARPASTPVPDEDAPAKSNPFD